MTFYLYGYSSHDHVRRNRGGERIHFDHFRFAAAGRLLFSGEVLFSAAALSGTFTILLLASLVRRWAGVGYYPR